MHAQSLSIWLFETLWTIPTGLLCPWDFPGKNTGVSCHFFIQGISLTQGLNPCLLHLLALAGRFFNTEPLGSPSSLCCCSVTKSWPTPWSNGQQHTRLLCPSPSPEVCPSSCPLNGWCHPTISSSSPSAFNLSQSEDLSLDCEWMNDCEWISVP